VATTAAGFFSLFTDHTKSPRRNIFLICGLLIGAVWSLIESDYEDKQLAQRTEAAIQRVDDYMTKQGSRVIHEVDQNTQAALNEVFTRVFGILPDKVKGFSPTDAKAVVDAAAGAGTLIREIPPERRQALTIWVFPHFPEEVGYPVVESRLHQLAGTVAVRGPKQQLAETNSVWWYAPATIEDAKAAALLVTGAGLHIRQICPSQLVKVPNLIQIGGSVRAQSLPILASEQIQQMKTPVCIGTPPVE
jgi:hypothetical protein